MPHFPPSLAPTPVRRKPRKSAVAQDITVCQFNAQSLRDKGVQSKSGVSLRMRYLDRILHDASVDVICIQESRMAGPSLVALQHYHCLRAGCEASGAYGCE
eukprot:9318052-Alexandrium_andersonii.AAC.1